MLEQDHKQPDISLASEYGLQTQLVLIWFNRYHARMTVTDIVQLELKLNPDGSPLDQLLSASSLERRLLIDAAAKGAVWHTRKDHRKPLRVRDLETGLSNSDTVYLNYNPQILAQVAAVPELVSDQVNYTVWNKPAGMLSQGSKWGDHCTITGAVASIANKPAYLVHRLDRAASGLIVVAHTRNALTAMTALFASRAIEKRYAVSVHGQMDKALPLTLATPIDGKSASSTIMQANYSEQSAQTELLVSISTGRKHQIRRHLQEAGFPVVGDRLYDKQREHTQDLQLCACWLSFTCPFTDQLIQVELNKR